jgi:hypothetical protein
MFYTREKNKFQLASISFVAMLYLFTIKIMGGGTNCDTKNQPSKGFFYIIFKEKIPGYTTPNRLGFSLFVREVC